MTSCKLLHNPVNFDDEREWEGVVCRSVGERSGPGGEAWYTIWKFVLINVIDKLPHSKPSSLTSSSFSVSPSLHFSFSFLFYISSTFPIFLSFFRMLLPFYHKFSSSDLLWHFLFLKLKAFLHFFALSLLTLPSSPLIFYYSCIYFISFILLYMIQLIHWLD